MNIDFLNNKLNDIIGLKVTTLINSYGSFLAFKFTGKRESHSDRTEQECNFIVSYCAWRLENSDGLWIGSEDRRDIIQEKIDTILKHKPRVQQFEVMNHFLDTIINFDDGHSLSIFSISSYDEDSVHWTPNNIKTKEIFEVGPGRRCEIFYLT